MDSSEQLQRFGGSLRNRVLVGCPRCRTEVQLAPSTDEWACGACRTKSRFLQCRFCGSTAQHVYAGTWPCPWCGNRNKNRAIASSAGEFIATHARFASDVTDSNWAVLADFRVVASQGIPTARGAQCSLVLSSHAICVIPTSPDGSPYPMQRYPAEELIAVTVGGPGIVQSGGGYVGFGIGAAGALEGAAIAAALNALTTTTKIHNVVQFTSDTAGFVLYNSTYSPTSLEFAFAPLQSRMLQIQTRRSAPAAAPISKYDELAKIAQLRDAGVLTEDEFQQQKAAILARG